MPAFLHIFLRKAVPVNVIAKLTSLSLAIVLLAIAPLCLTEAARSASLPTPAGSPLLTVAGQIQNTNVSGEAHFDAAMLDALPVHVLSTSTAVTDGVNRFEGVLMRDLLQAVGAQGTVVRASALNRYTTTIPMSDFYDYDVLLARSMNGKQLLPSDKGPLWIVYPRDSHRELRDMRYDYRWVWQLNRLVVQ